MKRVGVKQNGKVKSDTLLLRSADIVDGNHPETNPVQARGRGGPGDVLTPRSGDGGRARPRRKSSKAARAVDTGKRPACTRTGGAASLTVTGKDPAAVRSCTVSSATIQDGRLWATGLPIDDSSQLNEAYQ